MEIRSAAEIVFVPKINAKPPSYYEEPLRKGCEEKGYIYNGFVMPWIGAKTKVSFTCPVHGEITTGTAFDFIKRGVSCRQCADARTGNKRRKKVDDVMASIDDQCKKVDVTFRGFVGGVYVNSDTKLILECNKHHTVTDNTAYKSFVARGIHGCRECKCDAVRIPEEVALHEAKTLCNAAGYTFHGWNGKYNGVATKMILECSHGVKWDTTTLLRLRQKPDLACPCTTTRGYKTTKAGYLYIQELHGDVNAIKFGISNHNPYRRMRDQRLKSKLTHTPVFAHKFENGADALAIENEIKKIYKDKTKFVPRELMEDGYTETLPAELMTSLMTDIKVLIRNLN
ncbi:hypothetical protein MNG55_000797 [Escherichia coli]|nr:hypothetical protein [Escherichia coli]